MYSQPVSSRVYATQVYARQDSAQQLETRLISTLVVYVNLKRLVSINAAIELASLDQPEWYPPAAWYPPAQWCINNLPSNCFATKHSDYTQIAAE